LRRGLDGVDARERGAVVVGLAQQRVPLGLVLRLARLRAGAVDRRVLGLGLVDRGLDVARERDTDQPEPEAVEEAPAERVRDVLLERARYTDLKQKYDSARVTEDLERRQGGERFSVLYAAYPGRPAKPGQWARLLLMAIAAGFVLGAAMVMGREFLDRSVHDARALQSEFEVPVLGEIPRINRAV